MKYKNGIITITPIDFLKLIFLPIYLLILPIIYWSKKYNEDWSNQGTYMVLMTVYSILMPFLIIGTTIENLTRHREVTNLQYSKEGPYIWYMTLHEKPKLWIGEEQDLVFGQDANGSWHLLDKNMKSQECYPYENKDQDAWETNKNLYLTKQALKYRSQNPSQKFGIPQNQEREN